MVFKLPAEFTNPANLVRLTILWGSFFPLMVGIVLVLFQQLILGGSCIVLSFWSILASIYWELSEKKKP
jgi:hypothetical protein